MHFESLPYASAMQSRQMLLSFFLAITSNDRIKSTLQLIAEKAAVAAGGTMGAVIATVGQRFELLASWQISFSTLRIEWDARSAGHSWAEEFTCWDVEANSYIAAHPISQGAPFAKALVNVPIPLGEFPFPVSILVMSNRPIEVGDHAAVDAIRSIHRQLADIAASELSLASDIIKVAGSDWDGPNLSSACKIVDGLGTPAALIDANFTFLALNKSFHDFVGISPQACLGARLTDVPLPAREALIRSCRSVVATPESNDQEFIATFGEAGRMNLAKIICHPIAIGHGYRPLILLTMDSIVDSTTKGFEEAQASPLESRPIERFLHDTLRTNTAVRKRNDVNYITARSWRGAIKDYQVSALRAVKSAPSDAFASEISRELIAVLSRLSGTSPIDLVAPIPAGNSGLTESLSVKIARATASMLGVPVSGALAIDPPKKPRSSHPKSNMRRPPMRLVEDVSGKNVLIIDDVATSGRHIEEASCLLRGAAKSTMAIAWIGGDSQ